MFKNQVGKKNIKINEKVLLNDVYNIYKVFHKDLRICNTSCFKNVGNQILFFFHV